MRAKTIDRKVLKQATVDTSYSLNMASGLAVLADLLALLVTGGAIYLYYLGGDGASQELYIFAILAPSITVVAIFHQARLYDVESICNPMGQIPKILGILAVTFLVFLALAFALKVSTELSRVWVFSWFLSSAFLICLVKILGHFIFLRWARAGQLSRKIVVVGAGDQAKRFLNQVQLRKEPWISLVGVFDDRNGRVGPSFNGFPVLGNLNGLLDYVRKNRVDDIIITLPWHADQRLIEIIENLKELPVHIRLGSDLAGFLYPHSNYSSICGVPMLDMVSKPLDGWRYVLKGVEDRILGLFFLVLFSPLMLLIALAIKLENKGPVIFRQKRYGFNNKPFMVFKFRSMHHNGTPETKVVQAKPNDPRITPFGKFLRRTSLDELPQILNVLNGSMSLVGPRPHPIVLDEEFSKIIGGYFARHRVKPGITGWAQVNGLRGETDILEKMEARVKHDIYYIENWSLLFDAKILLMTVPAVLQRDVY